MRKEGALTVALVLGSACALKTTPPPTRLQEYTGLNATGTALRIQVRALVGPYVGQIEAAADEAARRCGEDPSVRIRALEWKLNAVALGQNALLQADPVVALFDGWAYALQMRDFLASDRGRAALGPCHRDAAASMDRIAREELGIASHFVPERAERVDRRVQSWAAEHPLQSLASPRATAAEALASESARGQLGALAAVGTIVESLDDLAVRTAAYRETLLKEARWIGELAAVEVTSSDALARAADDANRAAAAADRMGALAASIPALLERERNAAISTLREERRAILADIDAQRIDTLKAFQTQTDAMMDRLDATSRMVLEEAARHTNDVIDHALLRMILAAVALVAILALAVLLVARGLGVRFRAPRHT
jgi:hypothetical protein